MLKLPLSFDENEWFAVITMLFLIFCYIKVPKIISREMTITIFLFFATLGLTADIILGVDYPFDFYRIMDTPNLELFDVLVYIVNYSFFGYFFSYIICKWRMNVLYLLIFIILWSGLSTLIEWTSEKFNVFSYRDGWNIGFSSITYIFVFSYCAIIIKLFIHLWKHKVPN